MNRKLIATIFGVFAFSTAAIAQVEQPSQVSFQGTALITKDSNTDSGAHRATKSGGLLLGYSYQFNNWAGVEGNYGFTRNTQNYFGSFGATGIRADAHEVTGSFVFHIPARLAHVRPYALAGGGALVFDPTDVNAASIQRQTKGAFVYGGGFNFDVTRNFGVRTEYRGLVYKTPDFGTSALNLDKVTHLAQPSVGFFVRF